jgi:hypothetical protein
MTELSLCTLHALVHSHQVRRDLWSGANKETSRPAQAPDVVISRCV